jgi:alanyl-tRNA synthetase
MTERLYYRDSYLLEFTATVLEQRARDGKPAVELDRTAFYPASGGQPCDTGILGTANVLEVEETPSGSILHILDSSLPPGPVTGRVDWERRFDHMQQHSGQHVLSQAFLETAGAATASFHLGRETSTIDIGITRPSPEQIRAAEALATRTVFEDRPVAVINARPEELAVLGLRKESQRQGEVRVIEIEGFDRSPCGGTHVRRTGEIGLIAALGWEHYKGMTRIEFVCGGRALNALRHARDLLDRLGGQFSAHASDLPRLAAKLLDERSQLQRENARLIEKMLEIEALELLSSADKSIRPITVCRNYDHRDLENVKILARKLTAGAGIVAILGTVPDSAQIVVAKSSDVSGDCGLAVRQAAAALGGRGGGKADMAQAGGVPGEQLSSWSAAIASYFIGCRPQ